jgi:hypothetical protein
MKRYIEYLACAWLFALFTAAASLVIYAFVLAICTSSEPWFWTGSIVLVLVTLWAMLEVSR